MSKHRSDTRESTFPAIPDGIGREVRHVEVTDSTNRLARQWAIDGSMNGAVVVADHQTAGRGRQGRQWESSPGQNLLLTAILQAKEPLLSDHVARGMLPLATSLAVLQALGHFVPDADITIKWPNDIHLKTKKCAGILVEAGPNDTFLVGIGINVNQTDFSEPVGNTATSVLLHTGRRVDRGDIFNVLLDRMNYWIPLVFEGEAGGSRIREAYTLKMAGMGESVSLSTGSGSVSGILQGIHSDGGLIVESTAGRNVYYAGDVSLSHQL